MHNILRPASPHESKMNIRSLSPAGSSTRASIISTDGGDLEDGRGSMADSEGEDHAFSSDAGLSGRSGSGSKVHALRKRRKSSRLKSIISIHQQSTDSLSGSAGSDMSLNSSAPEGGRRKMSLRPTRLVVNKDKVVDVESGFPSSPLASSIFSGNMSEHEVWVFGVMDRRILVLRVLEVRIWFLLG